MDFLDTPSHISDPQKFILLGAYYGYPHCCTMAFMYRRHGVPKRAASFALGYDENFKLDGTGYVPCRYCDQLSIEDQIARINRHRLHPAKFESTHCDYEDNGEALNRAYLSGALFDNVIKLFVESMPDVDAKSQAIWSWADHQIKKAQKMFDKISELDKNDRPPAQLTHLRARCVSLGNLRYGLVKEISK